MQESDPGAPEALPKTLRLLAERLGAHGIERLWIFPPLRRGRKEWGLVVISTYLENDGRRRMHTARYTAERTGKGLTYEPMVTEEGILPAERFSRVLTGVVRRTEEDLGDPRTVEIEGKPDRLEALLDELDPSHLEAWQQ